MYKKLFYLPAILLSFVFLSFKANSQTKSLGIFDGQTDIGLVKPKGSLVYNPQTQQYTLSGAGANIWRFYPSC
jgi:TolB protein